MMPGENQSKPGEIASEATSGTCQNCTLLNQSLDEYVAALLTLKQKILDTDHLLSEYKEKCDELQKSQRESSKLHRQLDEVLLKLEPLEKQTVKYEQMKTELEKTKTDLKLYQQRSEDVDRLRSENAQTLILKGKLEESLRQSEDTIQGQNLENEKLSNKVKSLEADLEKTQVSLKKYLQTAEEHEILKLENAKTLIMKGNLENELMVLKETKCQQDNEVGVLKNEKRRLEEMLYATEQRLNTLEKEFNKEKKSRSSQTDPEIPIDKGKVRKLLEEIWNCMETSSQTQEKLFLAEEEATPLKKQPKRVHSQPLLKSPLRRPISYPSPEKASPETYLQCSEHSMSKTPPVISRQKSSPQKPQKQNNDQQFNRSCRNGDECSDVLEHVNTWTDDANKSLVKETTDENSLYGDYCMDLQDITKWLKPLPAALSPVHSPSIEMVIVNEDQPMCDTKQECQTNNGTPEALSSIHEDFRNNTELETLHIMDQNLEKEEVEKSSVLLSPTSHERSAVSSENSDLEKKLSDSQHMEVEDMLEVKHESVANTQSQTTNSGIEHSVERSLGNDAPQSAVELVLKSQNGEGTQLEDPKSSNLKNPLENSDSHQHIESEQINTDSTESAECKTSEVQPNVALGSNEQSILSSDENYSELNGVEKKKSKSSGQLQMNTEEDPPTHNVQNRLDIKGGQSEDSTEDNSLKPKEYHKGLNVGENGDPCPLIPLKDKELSLGAEAEGLSGLKKNVSGIEQCSTANQVSENEPQELTLSNSENRTPPFDLSTVLKSEDERNADQPENEGNIQSHTNKDSNEKVLNTPRKNIRVDGEICEQVDEISADSQTPGVSDLLSDVDHHKETSGDSTVDGIKDTSIPFQSALDPECSAFEKGGTISHLPGLNTNIHITPTSLRRVRTEMGPPLPPVVKPLTTTPPRFVKHYSPLKPTSVTTDGAEISTTIPSVPAIGTPSESCGVPSSPLQFGSATPKHAVPVPGRLPSSALSSSPPSASQENSMQMLDTMYPELSARARTLNILRGNVNLSRSGSENGCSPPSVNQILGNKTISSSSTAFTKTEQKPKRTGVNMLLPKSAKRLRLDNCSPAPPVLSAEELVGDQTAVKTESIPSPQEIKSNQEEQRIEKMPDDETKDKKCNLFEALDKVCVSSFDVLPVVKSHVYLGRISQVPILTDAEKAVIADFCVNQASAEKVLSAILTKLKTEKNILSSEKLLALCRVYTGICRQIEDHQKAHAFAYNILKEDFPDASKLILFMITTWPSVLFHETFLCKAIHTVAKLRSEEEILDYLTKYLHWDKNPPDDILQLINNTLNALQEDKDLTFQSHDRHGHDLCPAAWEYIYTLDLLCTHMKWKWTHDHVIGKKLWPIMNTWVTQSRLQQFPIRDVSVAAVLRLIGRLGQLGMKQMLCKSVQNVAKALNLFGKHGITEGVPKEVQLSAVYAIYDLAPCNPKDALEALASWRSETTQPVPPAVTSCITQIGSLCRQIKS